MASRPLYASGSSTQIKEMPDNEFSNMLGRIGYLYSTDPFTNVDVVLSGGNAGPALTDTRYRSGPLGQSVGDQDAFDDGLLEYDRNPGGPELLTVANYDRLNEVNNYTAGQLATANFDAAYYSNLATKPVKWNAATNCFQEMTYLEVVDAFIDEWYNSQSNPSSSNPGSAGAYFVSTNTSETGATRVSSTPVFVDTVADASSYQTALIGGAGVNYITNNFNAATGTSSTSLYSSLIGGSGIQINYTNVSPSTHGVYGFGDNIGGGGINSARPAGELLAYAATRTNHAGEDQFVITQDMFNTYTTYNNPTFNGQPYWGVIYPTIDNYPVTGDKHVRGKDYTSLSQPGPGVTYNNGFFTSGSSDDTLYGDRIEIDVTGADYLYMWAAGDRSGSGDPAYSWVYLKGTNGNTELISLSAIVQPSGPIPFFQQNYVNRLANAGLITSGSGNTSNANNGTSVMRFHLDGKVEKFIAQVLGTRQGAGFAFTKNVQAVATNSTGFDIETPVGTTRSNGSSFNLPVNLSGQWTLSAGTWQTSQVVGAAAQSNVVTFNQVTGSGTTANAALASLGGGIDVSVATSGQINATRRYTSNSNFTSVNSAFHGVGKNGWTGGYAFSDAALLTHPSGGNAFSGDTGTTRAGFRIPPGANYAKVEFALHGAGPFDPGGVNNSGISFRNTSNQSFLGFSGIESGGNIYFSGQHGFSATIAQTGSQLYYRSSSIFELPSNASHCYAYVFKQPGMYIRVYFYGGATATNNTGFDIETPVGTTRAAGTSWVLPSTTATPSGSWKIEAGRYYISSGTETYQDHFTTTNYYLHQMDQQKSTQGSGYKTPLVVDYDTNGDAQGLRAMTYQEFDDFFDPLVKYVTSSLAGYRLSYNVNGNGINIGNPIINQQMVGVTSQLSTRFVNVNDYRSQMFPNGVVVAQDTHRFKLEKY